MGKTISSRIKSGVTVGFIDGHTRDGWIDGFRPGASVIQLEIREGGDTSDTEALTVEYPTNQAAYIGFFRENAVELPVPLNGDTQPIHLDLTGGARFHVMVHWPDTTDQEGFYGVPVDIDDPFAWIYFFAHAVNFRRSDERLGTMLLREGLITPEQLEEALRAQKDGRKKTIGEILVEQNQVGADTVARAVERQKRHRLRIGELLMEAGLATEEEVNAALDEQRNHRDRRLGEILVDMNIVSEFAMTSMLAKKFSIPFVDLDGIEIDRSAVRGLPREIIANYDLLPIASDDEVITVAISDPLATEGPDLLRFNTGKQIREVLVTPSQLKRYMRGDDEEAPPAKKAVCEQTLGDILSELDQTDVELIPEETVDGDSEEMADSDSAIIRLVNQILVDAVRRGASDIHVEPRGREGNTGIRFRVDGACSTYRSIPARYWRPLVSRLKIMANLDISERRKPQDGKFRFRIEGRSIEIRVATLPTVNGNEDVVLRILTGVRPMALTELNLSERNIGELHRLVTMPHGLILCVGPTGSGKTTTLHALLSEINTEVRKIWTAEDPVEITQDGLRQLQVHPKIGLTFAAALRSFLRADPDVIMVGEMRDKETARIGIEASLTGHLVFSTLHTNSAPETITRLLDIGLEPFTFSDALLGVLAQRLTRILCPHCKEEFEAPKKEYDALAATYGKPAFTQRFGVYRKGDFRLMRAVGCDVCAGTGYRGRMALHELLVGDNDEMRRLIQQRASVLDIRALAVKQGMTTLVQDGIEKVIAGHTDLSQVMAVCVR